MADQEKRELARKVGYKGKLENFKIERFNAGRGHKNANAQPGTSAANPSPRTVENETSTPPPKPQKPKLDPPRKLAENSASPTPQRNDPI